MLSDLESSIANLQKWEAQFSIWLLAEWLRWYLCRNFAYISKMIPADLDAAKFQSGKAIALSDLTNRSFSKDFIDGQANSSSSKKSMVNFRTAKTGGLLTSIPGFETDTGIDFFGQNGDSCGQRQVTQNSIVHSWCSVIRTLVYQPWPIFKCTEFDSKGEMLRARVIISLHLWSVPKRARDYNKEKPGLS